MVHYNYSSHFGVNHPNTLRMLNENDDATDAKGTDQEMDNYGPLYKVKSNGKLYTYSTDDKLDKPDATNNYMMYKLAKLEKVDQMDVEAVAQCEEGCEVNTHQGRSLLARDQTSLIHNFDGTKTIKHRFNHDNVLRKKETHESILIKEEYDAEYLIDSNNNILSFKTLDKYDISLINISSGRSLEEVEEETVSGIEMQKENTIEITVETQSESQVAQDDLPEAIKTLNEYDLSNEEELEKEYQEEGIRELREIDEEIKQESVENYEKNSNTVAEGKYKVVESVEDEEVESFESDYLEEDIIDDDNSPQNEQLHDPARNLSRRTINRSNTGMSQSGSNYRVMGQNVSSSLNASNNLTGDPDISNFYNNTGKPIDKNRYFLDNGSYDKINNYISNVLNVYPIIYDIYFKNAKYIILTRYSQIIDNTPFDNNNLCSTKYMDNRPNLSATIGTLEITNTKVFGYSMEPPYDGNKTNTAIEYGIYDLIYKYSPTFKGKYLYLDINEKDHSRHSILIHGGRWPCHTAGCILPGTSWSENSGHAEIIKGNFYDEIIKECVKNSETIECKKIIILESRLLNHYHLNSRSLSEYNESDTIDLLLNYFKVPHHQKIKGLIRLYKCIIDKDCDDKENIIIGIEEVCNAIDCPPLTKNILLGLVDPRYLCVIATQELTKPIRENLSNKVSKLSAGVNESTGSSKSGFFCKGDQNESKNKEIILGCVPFFFARGCISYDMYAGCSSKVSAIEQKASAKMFIRLNVYVSVWIARAGGSFAAIPIKADVIQGFNQVDNEERYGLDYVQSLNLDTLFTEFGTFTQWRTIRCRWRRCSFRWGRRSGRTRRKYFGPRRNLGKSNEILGVTYKEVCGI
eukprot:Mrub_00582.p1 GENE.Mrub_00582~~Mrub_00582.p1  ORF type:complete len:984 (+),score=134.83 Mrub_00582:378-2954(+)